MTRPSHDLAARVQVHLLILEKCSDAGLPNSATVDHNCSRIRSGVEEIWQADTWSLPPKCFGEHLSNAMGVILERLPTSRRGGEERYLHICLVSPCCLHSSGRLLEPHIECLIRYI